MRLEEVLYFNCVDKKEYLDVHDELEDKENAEIKDNYKSNESLEK